MSRPRIDPIVKLAIELAGGPIALARKVGVTKSTTYDWRRIPPHHVIAVEKCTGIPRHRLRPDLYPKEDD